MPGLARPGKKSGGADKPRDPRLRKRPTKAVSKKSAAAAKIQLKPDQRSYFFMEKSLSTPPPVPRTALDKLNAARYIAKSLVHSDGWSAWKGCGSHRLFAAAIRELGIKKAFVVRYQVQGIESPARTPVRTPEQPRTEDRSPPEGEVVESEARREATAAAEAQGTPSEERPRKRRRLFSNPADGESTRNWREPVPLPDTPTSSPPATTSPLGGSRSPGLNGEWLSFMDNPEWALAFSISSPEQSTPATQPQEPEVIDLGSTSSEITIIGETNNNNNSEVTGPNSTQEIMREIEHLLGDSSDSSDEEEDADVYGEGPRIIGGRARWDGRCARTSLSLALGNIQDAEADLGKTHHYNDLRPRIDNIKEYIRLASEEIGRRMERMLI